MNILKTFDEFEVKFKHFKGKIESKNEYKKLYKELTLEYNNIIDKADEIWEFNIELIRDLEEKSKIICNKIGINGFVNIKKEILNKAVDSYIKLDKDLIIIKNKIKGLINLII